MFWKVLLVFAVAWSLTGHSLTRPVWAFVDPPMMTALVVGMEY